MKINEIKQLADKKYVSGTVVGRISSTRNLTDTMSAGKLGDDTDTIDLTAFSKDIRKFDGKEVKLTGMGMRKDSHNGYDKLIINEKTVVSIIGDSDSSDPTDSPPSPFKPTPVVVRKDDDYVPQTLTYMMGDALAATLNDPSADGMANVDIMASYAVAMYNAREKAVATIREAK